MKPFTSYREIVLVCLLLVFIALFSCQCYVEEPQPLAYNYMNVPEGDTAIVKNLNIAGMGARINNMNTTWIIKGNVVMDELAVMGHVIIEEKASLTIARTVYIAESGTMTVYNQLKYAALKKDGKLRYHTSKN